MNKKVDKIINSAKKEIIKNSPKILIGFGIGGMLTSVIFAVKATPKVIKLKELKEKEGEKLTKFEFIKIAWKPYMPATISFIASTAMIIGADSIHSKRNVVLATAYKLSENVLTEYQEKVKQVVGEEKEKEIRDEIAKDRINNNPVKQSDVIITGKGESLCYDSLSGRYFKSDIDKIRKAENVLNRRLINDMYVSLNEFYDEIGLSYTSIGEKLGWNISKGMIEISFSAQLSENETPCLVIDYSVAPEYNYQNLM